jgi:hypothetical protein
MVLVGESGVGGGCGEQHFVSNFYRAKGFGTKHLIVLVLHQAGAGLFSALVIVHTKAWRPRIRVDIPIPPDHVRGKSPCVNTWVVQGNTEHQSCSLKGKHLGDKSGSVPKHPERGSHCPNQYQG